MRYVVLGWVVEELGDLYSLGKSTISRWVREGLGQARNDPVLRAMADGQREA